MDLAVELEDGVAAEDEHVLVGLVVRLDRGDDVLGLGPGEEQGDVRGVEGAVEVLRRRDDRVLVDRRDANECLDAGGEQGGPARRRGGGEEQRGAGRRHTAKPSAGGGRPRMPGT